MRNNLSGECEGGMGEYTALINQTHNFNIKIDEKRDRVEFNIRGEFPPAHQVGEHIENLYTIAEEYGTCVVYINSPGGDISTLTETMTALRKFQTIITIAGGQVCSAGFILWCFGDIRFIQDHTSVMIHRESYGSPHMKTNQHMDQAKHLNALCGDMIKETCEFLTEEEFQKIGYADVFFTDRDLIERGVGFPWKRFLEGNDAEVTPAVIINNTPYVPIDGNRVSDFDGVIWDVNDILYQTGNPPKQLPSG